MGIIMSGDSMGRGGSVYKRSSSSFSTRARKASMYGRFDLTGDVELIQKLNTLGDRVYKKVLSLASSRAVKPVIDTARRLAPKETGLLKKSIGTKQKKYPKNGVVVAIVGPRTGFAQDVVVDTPYGKMKSRRDPAKYAHLVEYGTRAHSTAALSNNKIRPNKSGEVSEENRLGFAIAMQGGDNHPGATPKPFMRPAFDANTNRVIAIFRQELAAGVRREAMSK